jgi:hypothetical protein
MAQLSPITPAPTTITRIPTVLPTHGDHARRASAGRRPASRSG